MTWLFDLPMYLYAIGGTIGLVRWRVMQRNFRPFVLLICINGLNEIILTLIQTLFKTQNLWEANIYSLLEAGVLIYFFKKQGLFYRTRWLANGITLAFCCIWIFEVLIWKNIFIYNSIFGAVYSLTAVLLSITALNRLLIASRKLIFTEALFLICTGFIIYYTLSVLFHGFMAYGLSISNRFAVSIAYVLLAGNICTSILYIISVLRIPRRALLNYT